MSQGSGLCAGGPGEQPAYLWAVACHRELYAASMTDDRSIRERIGDLVHEEHSLREQVGRHEISPHEEQARLRTLEIELDQCWDLLRQRAAKREFGEDPESAQARSADVVERYLG